MSNSVYYTFPRLTVIDIEGADADTIVHNLTTNEVKMLQPQRGCETFVTEVRGRTLGHVCLFRHDGFLRMVGPAGQSEAIANHLDRYTILEDATAVIRDDHFSGVVIPPDSVLLPQKLTGPDSGIEADSPARLLATTWSIDDHPIDLYQTHWLGFPTWLMLVPQEKLEQTVTELQGGRSEGSVSVTDGGELDFHRKRIEAGFPWFGIDLTDANLPQEADRDEIALSFTKGCYLGQETVARLDALGQVQKKLVRWKIEGCVPTPGSAVMSDGKVVGRLSSITSDEAGNITALGMVRRSHFEPGSTGTGELETPDPTEAHDRTFRATVLSNPGH